MIDLTEEKLKACQVKPVDTLPYAEEIQNLKEENLMLKGLLRECKPFIRSEKEAYIQAGYWDAGKYMIKLDKLLTRISEKIRCD